MTNLTESSLAGAMLDCNADRVSKVGIVFSTYQRLSEFSQAMVTNMAFDSNYSVSTANRNVIRFDNGNEIRLLSLNPQERLMGHRFERILIDPEITDDNTIYFLSRLEVGQPNRKTYGFGIEDELEIDPDPIDKFLDTFCRIGGKEIGKITSIS